MFPYTNICMPYPGGAVPGYNQLLADIQTAINDEVSAVRFYTKLMEMAPCDAARKQIQGPRDDEIKHYRMLRELYISLTGYEPMVVETVKPVTDFCEGVADALNDEIEGAEFYRRMYLYTRDMRIRDMLFEIMTDEMLHATRFNFVYSLADCENKECET